MLYFQIYVYIYIWFSCCWTAAYIKANIYFHIILSYGMKWSCTDKFFWCKYFSFQNENVSFSSQIVNFCLKIIDPIKYYIGSMVYISTRDKPQLHGLDLLQIIREEIGKKLFSPEMVLSPDMVLYQCKNKHTLMCSMSDHF